MKLKIILTLMIVFTAFGVLYAQDDNSQNPPSVKKYAEPGVMEAGGFMSTQIPFLNADAEDNNLLIRVFPTFNYFLLEFFSVGIKSEVSVNLTTSDMMIHGGIVPQATLPLPSFLVLKEWHLFLNAYLGAHFDSSLTNALGYRYANEIGVKFLLNKKLFLNVGLQYFFSNHGDKKDAFQNVFLPTVSVTGWFF